jgi:hypothetical protein
MEFRPFNHEAERKIENFVREAFDNNERARTYGGSFGIILPRYQIYGFLLYRANYYLTVQILRIKTNHKVQKSNKQDKTEIFHAIP